MTGAVFIRFGRVPTTDRTFRIGGRTLAQFAEPLMDAAAAACELGLELLDRAAACAQQLELALDMAQGLVEDDPAPALVDVAGRPLGAQRRSRILRLDEGLELVERHTEQFLQLHHVAQALDIAVVVDAVRPVFAPLGGRQQADLLVVADRPGRRADRLCDLADPHESTGSPSGATRSASGARTCAGRISETPAPASETAASTHSAVCMFWMNGASC